MDLKTWPGVSIWDRQALKLNVVIEQDQMEGSFWRPGFFCEIIRVLDLTSGPKSLGLDIWPRWSICDGHPFARRLETNCSHGLKSHGRLTSQARHFY